MVWVRSEYAGELAVLSTWFAALVPWNVHYAQLSQGASVLFVRFPLFQVRYTFGVPIAKATQLGLPLPAMVGPAQGTVVSVIAYQDLSSQLRTAYRIWMLGALVYLAALAVSVQYYRHEERVESWSVDPVRLLGGLLLATAVLLGTASAFTFGVFPGVPIPVGVLLIGAFGGVLLRAERRD